MSLVLGLDVGTVAGVAATKRDGHVDPCELGEAEAEVPSVVVNNGDGTFLIGEEAARAGGQELVRLARDLRRDPMLQADPSVGGGASTPSSPYTLLRALYAGVVERVCTQHDAIPHHVVVTHPARSSGLQSDVVDRIADDLFPGALLVPEPVAAAMKFAGDSAIPTQGNLIVFDFGGGTLDMAVVRREDYHFTLLGDPTAVNDLGGINIDDMVLNHVDEAVDGAVSRLREMTPEQRDGASATEEELAAADVLARLRADCRRAKETLSSADEVTIDASVLGQPAEVAIRRHDLEELLFPRLEQSMDAMEAMVLRAGLRLSEVDAIAAVGGSVRIPLVTQLLEARTGLPVLTDANPALTTALGAAQMVDENAPAASVFPISGDALPALATSGAGPAGGAGAPSDGSAGGSRDDRPFDLHVHRHVRNGLIGGTLALLVTAGITFGLRRPTESLGLGDEAGEPYTHDAGPPSPLDADPGQPIIIRDRDSDDAAPRPAAGQLASDVRSGSGTAHEHDEGLRIADPRRSASSQAPGSDSDSSGSGAGSGSRSGSGDRPDPGGDPGDPSDPPDPTTPPTSASTTTSTSTTTTTSSTTTTSTTAPTTTSPPTTAPPSTTTGLKSQAR